MHFENLYMGLENSNLIVLYMAVQFLQTTLCVCVFPTLYILGFFVIG